MWGDIGNGANWVGDRAKEFAEGVYNAPVIGLKELVVEPVKTLINPKASWGDKALAAGGLLLLPLSGAAPTVVKISSRAVPFINKVVNNTVRIGGGRISIGPAPKHYAQLGAVGKILSPIHIHIETSKIWIDLNWFKIGIPLFRSSWFK